RFRHRSSCARRTFFRRYRRFRATLESRERSIAWLSAPDLVYNRSAVFCTFCLQTVDLALLFKSFVHHKVAAMSLWKENTATKPTTNFAPDVHEPPARFDAHAAPKPEVAHTPAPAPAPAPVVPRAETHVRKESLIAADITIEGKIEGGGSVRIAGSFKGDVNVQGDLAIESGAKLTGSVRASNVTVAGELEGNIQEAKRVELTQSAVVLG